MSTMVLPGVAPFELGVVCEVFGIDREDTAGPRFDFTLCAEQPGPVTTSLGFDISVEHGLEAAAAADLVVVPAFPRQDPISARVRDVLRAAADRGAWVLSVCSGAFALGAAGLLDGRRCTTHWMYSHELAERFPRATVDPDVLYVEDSGVITSAGTAAGIDACLHLVRRERGAAAATAIARRMVVPPHRDGGQAQYIDRAVPVQAETLGPLLDWLVDNLDQDLTVPQLARRVSMSERTFARRFRAETGTTPAAWLTRQRVLRAQELLEQTDLDIEEIARRSGFGSAAALRHHFTRTLGTRPQAYRRRFAGPVRGVVVGRTA